MLANSSASRMLSCGIVTFLLTACTTPNIHKTNTFSADKQRVETLSIDAKQRVVIFTSIPSWEVSGPNVNSDANKALIGKYQTVTCAEPSPDALSALSSSVGGGIADPKVAANFAFAQAESAASIGLRTQSIQLLRDGMYRLCEGYAGGAIEAAEFNRQQRRYQNLMLSLLAIEQLTGAVVARQVGLGEGRSSASVGDKADEAAGNLAKANSDVTAAQSALTKAQTTQAADEKSCNADSQSAGCGKAADDKTAVDNAQSALDKAKEVQKTDQEVLLAARASVKAEASGARVHFDAPPKAGSTITEGTARYIAEATRTIVTTTLLASNAQEDCARFFDFIAGPLSDNLKIQTLNFLSLDGGSKAQKPLSEPDKAASSKKQELTISQNCIENQQALLKQAALFTPQYGSAPAGPLQVLGASPGITLAADAKKPLTYFVVGGVPYYRVNDPPAELSKEVTWSLKSDNGNFQLVVSRPSGASKEGKPTIYLLDSNNAHVEILVSLTGKTLAVGKISNVTFKSGNLEVAFTPPAGVDIDKAIATAANTNKKDDVLTGVWDGKANMIDIEKCTDGQAYSVQVIISPKTGDPIKIPYGKTVNCSAAGAPAPKAVVQPEAPTAVSAQPGTTSGTIAVSFTPADEKGGGPISGYTATATDKDTKKTTQPIGTTTDGKAKAVTIVGCVGGDTYTVSIVSTRGGMNSKAAAAGGEVECKK